MEIRSLGRYEVRGEIGRGTMGVVYRGYDPVLDREIALKAVNLSPALEPERRKKFLDRFFLEAKIAGKLIHPNIVVTHDAATDEKTAIPFIAMELLSGDSLYGRLQKGRIPWEEALGLVEPLARALDYAHQQGVVHRDIKPANILLTAKGVPKIADFGIAKLPTAQLTLTGTVMGTPYYMSPEQLEGDDVDGRSDLFSLGALLYHLLTGEPPFRGDDIATITQQVIYKSPTPPSELEGSIPASVDALIARAMTKSRDERYDGGEELAEEVERVRRGGSPLRGLSVGERTVETQAKPSPRAEPPDHDKAESKGGGAGFLVAGLVLAAIAAGAIYRWDDVGAYLEPIRERHEESQRRDLLSEQSAMHLDRGRDLLTRAHFDEARSELERSLSLAREANDGKAEATGLLWRGLLLAERGEWSSARADLDSAASVFEIYDVPDGKALALLAQADLERDLGRYEHAASLYEKAAPSVDTTLGSALMALLEGDMERAEQGFVRAEAYDYAGAAAYVRGDPDKATEYWSRREDTGLWRGFAALAEGDVDDARALFEESAARYRAADHRSGIAAATEGLEACSSAPDARDESILQTLFRAEPRTPRAAERRRRLPSTPGY